MSGAAHALEIGAIMLVTGAAQLAIAPIAVVLEQRVDARLLTFAGLGLFAAGLAMSGFQTPQTRLRRKWSGRRSFAALRSCSACSRRLAWRSATLSRDRVPDASGLFNLMRNLGGAIGLAMIDTIIYSRSPVIGAALADRLERGDVDAANFIGIPDAIVATRPSGSLDAALHAMLEPLIEKAAMAQAINEAWITIAMFTVAALVCVPFAKAAFAPRPEPILWANAHRAVAPPQSPRPGSAAP